MRAPDVLTLTEATSKTRGVGTLTENRVGALATPNATGPNNRKEKPSLLRRGTLHIESHHKLRHLS